MRLIFILILTLSSPYLIAAQCDAVFPNGVQSFSNSGRLTINNNAQIVNAPSTVLPFVAGSINANNGTSCVSAECTVSGFASESLDISSEFPSFSGDSFNSYGSVLGEGSTNTNVFGYINAKSGTTSFSSNYSTYYLNGMTISKGASIDLKPGTYYIQYLNINSSNTVDDVAINVIGTGTVYLYVSNLNVNKNRVINGFTDTAVLNIIAYQYVNFNSDSQGEGVLYSLATATFNNGSVFTGSVSAQSVTLNNNSTINYVDDVFTTYEFENVCTTDVAASQRALYEFNETGWSGSNTVIDSSGNGFDGTPLGTVTPISYSGESCQVLNVPANTSSSTIDAVDTEIDLNDIGDVGSISFWYRSDLDWSDSTGRQLVDASNQAPSQDKYFYLSLEGGELQFGVEDDDDYDLRTSLTGLSYTANEWVYITIVWDVPNNGINIYLNNDSTSRSQSASNSNFNGALGDMDTVYIGDNRSDYFVSNSSRNSAHGEFENVAIYNYALTSSEAATFAGSEPNCGTLDTELIAHWPMNVCAFDGDSGEVVDVIAGANGVAVDGASISENGQLCQTSAFAGNGQHLNIPHVNDFEIAEGSVSMWFQVEDLAHENDSSIDALVLFSKDSNDFDSGGHLTIYVSQDGSINARHQSTSASYYAESSGGVVSENTWHHIVYTFGSKGMEIYLDTKAIASQSYTGGLNGNDEPIIVGSGAWRTGNQESDPADLYDHFIGKIDDVRLYLGQLEQTEIDDLFDVTDDACSACPNVDVLESHWPLDVCSLSGNSDEIIDVINGYHGASVDGVTVLEEGKFCQAGNFNGDGDHLNIPNVSAFETGNGAISFWFNTSSLSHSDTSDQGGQGLYSRDSSGYDSGGHLTIWLQPTGAIRIRHQDTNSNNEINTDPLVTAETWHHLVYTWGSNGMRLYVDGGLVDTNLDFTSGTSGNSEPMIFGANAWTSGDDESAPSSLKDFFKGQMDEIKYYSNQIDSDLVTELFEQSQYDCSECDTDELVAQYQFEQDSWTGNNAVLDNSNNTNHATHLGLAVPINPSDQKACKAMEVPASSSINDEYNGIDTNVDINTLGNKGSISFWYRSNEAWNSGNTRQLFDASTDLGDLGQSKYFYLAITGAGNLDFNMEDDDDNNFGASTSLSFTYAADVWKHIAVSWDLQTQEIAIYIDGVSQSLSSTNDSNLTTTLGDLDTLYIGDNRSDYLVVTSTQNSANGEFDDVRIYNYVQDTDEVITDRDALTTCSFVYQYLIEHDGTGLTCEAESVTISACANESCTELYDQDITVDMSPNNGWTNDTSVTILANTPTTVSLSQLDAGTVTLDVLNENTLCEGTTNDSCDMVFSDAGFQFIGATTADTFADQIAQSNFANAQLRAVKTDINDGIGVCVAALEGTQSVSFGMTCDDPGSCVSNIETGASQIVAGSTTNLDLVFDDNGIASLSNFSYADAGQITLSVESTIDGASVAIGSTQFVVVPDRLSVTTASSTTHTRAGEAFELQISALGSQGAVLPNYQPGNLQLSLTRVLPTAGVSVDGVLTYALSDTMTVAETASFQDSGINAAKANVSVSSGVYRLDAQYNEYGQISLDVKDASFFGSSITTATSNGSAPITLGLFIPAYFDVQNNTPALASACNVTSGFTYLGEATGFSTSTQLTVTAKNSAGQTTENYQDDSVWTWLAAADASDIALADAGVSGSVSFNVLPNIDVGESVNLGSRIVTLSDSQVLYSKSTLPYAAFSSSLDINFLPSFITDNSYAGEAICYHQSFDVNNPDDCDTQDNIADLDDTNNVVSVTGVSGTQYRWGRMLIDNGFGPENEDLLLAVSTEYFDGNNFIKNTDDSCTTQSFSASDFVITDSNDASTSLVSILNSSFGITSGQTLGFEGIKVRNQDASTTGEYRIELQPINDSTNTWDDYLQYDWNGDDSGIGNPSALISFGQFRGNDRIIHWREVGT